ncbi:MAG: TonB family protein [Deltaproteobacteria bacterium]|jgi:TonB family protein|nr:TonB family protein [Deltaproteobacteria bacterium]
MSLLLKSCREETEVNYFGPERQLFTLFFVLALALHLAAFSLWEFLGLSKFYSAYSYELPVEQYLELALELAGPTEAETVPEASETPAISPEEALLLQEALAKAQADTPPPEPAPEPAAEAKDYPALGPSTNLVQGSEQNSTPLTEQTDSTIKLEDTAPEFKSYHTYVRSAVARHWILPPEARTNFQPGRFVAVMTLSREGQVVLIVVEESSGSPGLDYAAMEALRGAAPYPPFPPELQSFEQLNFRLHFDYRAIQRRIGPSEQRHR